MVKMESGDYFRIQSIVSLFSLKTTCVTYLMHLMQLSPWICARVCIGVRGYNRQDGRQ